MSMDACKITDGIYYEIELALPTYCNVYLIKVSVFFVHYTQKGVTNIDQVFRVMIFRGFIMDLI